VGLSVPRNLKGTNTTLLASMSLLGGMGETMAVEGSTNQEVFETYLEKALAPTLKAGQRWSSWTTSQSAQTGQGKRADRVEGLRVDLPTRLLAGFQPAVEEAFAKIKSILRRAGARTKDALIDVLSEALSAICVQDARGYFEHAGYRTRAQLL
jgi:Asp-tRNA(Asn)/Glu-tRNA(Gln) amidotransferase A subunit family amidase